MQYHHTFRVMGSGQFPIDMLRYDRCFPADEAQSYLIDPSDDEKYGGKKREIRLAAGQDKHWRPTWARWDSFTWKVHPFSHDSYKI